MTLRLVSDVHGATAKLRRVAAGPGPLLVLGDLINFIDYRNHEGLVADAIGRDRVARMVAFRTAGDYAAARGVWNEVSRGREDELHRRFADLVDAAYRDICSALDGVQGFVIYGNADQPTVLQRHLPGTMRFVDAEVVEIEGYRVGFAGGGVASPLGVAGEVTDAAMAAKLAALGPVDILCTHVAPQVGPLASDVVGGNQKGSTAVREYLLEHRPTFHYFGDIHQPRAVSWRFGDTLCRNLGYFRATGKVVHHG